MKARLESASPDLIVKHNGGARVPVFESFSAGWSFLIRKFFPIAARAWVPGVLIFLLDQRMLAASQSGLGVPAGLSILNLAGSIVLPALIATSAYALALGEGGRPVLARLTIGTDEMRVITALVLVYCIVAAFLVGAWLVGQQTVIFLSDAEFITVVSAAGDPTNIEYFKDLELLEAVALIGPFVIAGLIALWFLLRFSFVPAHLVAVRKFAIFEGLGLSRHNVWRLLALYLLIGLSILIVAVVVAAVLGAPFASVATSGFAPEFAGQLQANVFNPKNTPTNAIQAPAWVGSAISAVVTSILTIVSAAATAHAYRRVAGV